VLAGTVDRGDAAVVGQLLNGAVRAVSVGLKAREQQELEERLEQLETLLESRNEGGSRGWG
jgi:NAD(P)H-hydrate repair Nnr-like enzyme with NAD(P)H-hydrate epimerase domain